MQPIRIMPHEQEEIIAFNLSREGTTHIELDNKTGEIGVYHNKIWMYGYLPAWICSIGNTSYRSNYITYNGHVYVYIGHENDRFVIIFDKNKKKLTIMATDSVIGVPWYPEMNRDKFGHINICISDKNTYICRKETLNIIDHPEELLNLDYSSIDTYLMIAKEYIPNPVFICVSPYTGNNLSVDIHGGLLRMKNYISKSEIIKNNLFMQKDALVVIFDILGIFPKVISDIIAKYA